MGNPAIFPLIYNCNSADVVIVHINPAERPDAQQHRDHGLQISAGDHLVVGLDRDLPEAGGLKRGSDDT